MVFGWIFDSHAHSKLFLPGRYLWGLFSHFIAFLDDGQGSKSNEWPLHQLNHHFYRMFTTVWICLDGANGSHAPLDISNDYGSLWDEIFVFLIAFVSVGIIWNLNTNLNAQYIYICLSLVFSLLCFVSLFDWLICLFDLSNSFLSFQNKYKMLIFY